MTDQVFDLLLREGMADYIGEPITQIEHMLEAAEIAFTRSYPSFVVVACLFHDIGHLLENHPRMGLLGVKDHEKIGAEYLRNLEFPEETCDLVENHVSAKRYLISIDPEYQLSEASTQTLEYQGGRMSEEEIQEFRNRPNFQWYLKMRQIDEEAKGDQFAKMKLEDFREICENFISP